VPTIDAPTLQALLARYGHGATRWRSVADLGTQVLRIATTSGAELALRIYPTERGDRAPIETELVWLADLAAQGLRVPRPLVDRDGAWIQPWNTSRSAVLLSWVRGRFLDRGLRPVHLRRCGRLMAQLHDSADRLATQGRLSRQGAADMPDLPAWVADQRAPVPPHWPAAAQQVAMASARRVQAELARWSPTPASHGLIHGDLHPWNLLFARGEAGLIDFTDCGWGWRALDFASTLQFLQHPLAGNHDHRGVYPRLRDALLAGYAELRPLWPGVERQIDTLTAARWLLSVEWILDVWPRPDLRPFGPGLLRGVVDVWPDLLARLEGAPDR
jgi:Ser/Thr protein kinase RdoA (MazF antagonist)